jgi:hypothetical protein
MIPAKQSGEDMMSELNLDELDAANGGSIAEAAAHAIIVAERVNHPQSMGDIRNPMGRPASVRGY